MELTTCLALLVDDKPANYGLINDLLKDIKTIQVELDWITTESAASAVIANQAYDVYLIDAELGKITLLPELLDRTCTAPPVIVLTDTPEAGITALSAGAADYLVCQELSTLVLERSLRLTVARARTQAQLQGCATCYRIQCQQTLLQQSQELHELILSNISDAILMADNSGNFTFISPNVDVIFGYSRSEVQELGNIRYLLGESLFDTHQLETCGEIPNIEREITDKFGKKHTLLLSIKHVSIQTGTVLYTCHDITQRKQAEQEIVALNAELEQRVRERTAKLTQEIQERQRVEDSLRESQQQFATIVENIPGGVYRAVYHADGRISLPYLSSIYHEWLGIAPGNIMSDPELDMTAYIHPEDLDRFAAAVKEKFQTLEFGTLEYRLISQDGQVRWIQDNARFYRNDQGDIIVDGVDIDISDRKQVEQEFQQAQQALYLQEQEFRALVENSPDVISRFDRQLRHVYVSPVIERITEIPPAAFIGKTNRELGMPEELVSSWEAALQKVFDTGESELIEFEYSTPTGTINYQSHLAPEYAQDSSVEFVLCVSRDITDRKRAEAELRQSQLFIETIANTSPQLLYIYDLTIGCNIYVNRQISEILGYTPEEIRQAGQQFFLDTIHPDDLHILQDILRRFSNLSDGEVVEAEYRMRYKHGSWCWLRSRDVVFTRAADGSPQQILGTALDITERKLIQMQLQESESQLNAIVNSTSDGILIVDRQGSVRFVNPAAAKLFGRPPAELLNHEFGQPMVVGEVAELGIVRPGGELGIGEMSIAQTEWQGESVYVVSLRDITERRQAEEALRQSEERFRQMAENIQDIFWLFCPQTQQVLYISPAYQKIWGCSMESAYADPDSWLDAVHPEDRELTSVNSAKNQQGEFPTKEYRIVRSDGEMRWICDRLFPIKDELGVIYRIAGISEDITDRKRTEAQLQQYRDRLEELVEQRTEELVQINQQLQEEILERQRAESAIRFQARLLDLVNHAVIATDLSSTITYWNRFAEKLYGWSATEALGRNVIEMTPAEMSREQALQIMACLRRGESWSGEFMVEHRDGTCFPVIVTDSPIYDEVGQLIGIVGISFDITERKQAEEALKNANAELGIAVEARTRDLGSAITQLRQEIAKRKQVETDLRASEARYRAIIEDQVEVVCRFQLDGTLTFVNDSYCRYFGKSRNELIGTNLLSLVAPEDREWIERGLVEFWQKRPEIEIAEHRVTAASGESRWMQWTTKAIFDGAGYLVEYQSVGRDTTDKKQAEETLRQQMEREKLLAQIAQHIRQSLNLDDILSTTVVEVQQLLQTDRTLIFRLGVDNTGIVTHEAVAPGWPKTLGYRFENEEFPPQCYQNYCQGHPRIIPDIKVDETASCLLGYLQNLGVKSRLVVPILQREKFWGLLIVHQCRDIRHWQEWEVNLLGQLATQVGIAIQQAELYYQLEIELAERKQIQAQLQQAKEAAEAANRSKSDFLANMSHELRTPLNAILGFTQLMAHSSSLCSTQREHLKIISRSGEHLLCLINDILDLSKIEAGRIILNNNSFDLYRLLNTLEQMFQLKAAKKALQILVVRTPTVPQYVQTDESKLRQVLINLLDNAVKFTQKGTVTLRVEGRRAEGGGWRNQQKPVDERNKENFSSPTSPYSLYFEVEDTGPGIVEAEIHNLFEAFVQTATGKQSQSGTGLGLAIAQRFVRIMGGDITVSSVLGQGTIFKFKVQINLAEADRVVLPQRSQRAISLAPNQLSSRILVVEDNLAHCQLLSHILEPLGFEVCQAENGREGVALWESWQPHLILMDMHMPIMDGYEATRQIRDRERETTENLSNSRFPIPDSPFPIPHSRFPIPHSHTVIIAITASAFTEERDRFLAAGCDDVVIKPFRQEEIVEKIAQYLGVRYLYKDSPPVDSCLPISTYPPLTPEALAIMPGEWVAQLYQAAISLDEESMHKLIQEIPSKHSLLVTALADLIDNFRFDTIVALTKLSEP
ncbi:MAG TPA: hypothetical protein DDZ80_19980 [Cyanobacteria bacterium UBA8803]|nr:hypothetical protein [Cyanobacteria bacterium UBA8803]